MSLKSESSRDHDEIMFAEELGVSAILATTIALLSVIFS